MGMRLEGGALEASCSRENIAAKPQEAWGTLR